jgi:hypothetical protein
VGPNTLVAPALHHPLSMICTTRAANAQLAGREAWVLQTCSKHAANIQGSKRFKVCVEV